MMFNCVFVTFPCGILGQIWKLIVSIPDLCSLSYLIPIFLTSPATVKEISWVCLCTVINVLHSCTGTATRGLSFHKALIIEFRLDHAGAELFVMDITSLYSVNQVFKEECACVIENLKVLDNVLVCLCTGTEPQWKGCAFTSEL